MFDFIPDANFAGKKISSKHILYFIIAIILSILQVTVVSFISVANLTPDFLIILIVWIALNEGHMFGILSGFFIGLVFDFVSMDVIGTNAFAKLLVGFIAGLFYKENRINKLLGTYSLIGIVFISAFVHNLGYFFFYIKPSEISFFNFFLRYGIASTLYTTVFSVIIVLVKLRKK